MEILRKDENQNLIINKEQDFLNDLGWQENMIQFEDEVLSTIINPIENYETVRYIHKPYDTTVSGLTFSQTDIWYNFYFVSGTSYTQDYNIVIIIKTPEEYKEENEKWTLVPKNKEYWELHIQNNNCKLILESYSLWEVKAFNNELYFKIKDGPKYSDIYGKYIDINY